MIGTHLPAAILLLALVIALGEGGDARAATHGKPSGAKAKEAAAPQAPPAPELDPQAVDILKASGGGGSWSGTGYRDGTASGGGGTWHGTTAYGTPVYGVYCRAISKP